MPTLTDEEIRGKIIYNIKRKREQYINVRNAVKGFPPEMFKEVSQVLRDMLKEGLLLPFKKGQCVGVNMAAREEVLRLIEVHLQKRYPDH
ncbi:MAG: hypothetical protein HY520_04500 [Candidatus Aenigmarchaeota archaeon]|nr:hypothetical protein [Candidatus Aenigmarchaeota archaeon]